MDDHFRGRSLAARSFKDNYLQLWGGLMREAAAAEVLFDGHLLPKLKDLVVALNWCALLRIPGYMAPQRGGGIVDQYFVFGICLGLLLLFEG